MSPKPSKGFVSHVYKYLYVISISFVNQNWNWLFFQGQTLNPDAINSLYKGGFELRDNWRDSKEY